MKRKPVHSSSVASIGYDSDKRELDIEFRDSGEVYRYIDVSPKEHAEFMAADSKGTYLNSVFKAKEHPYSIVKHGRRK